MIRRLFGVLAMAGILASGLAVCVSAEPLEAIQMACCKTGHHDCGPKGEPANCCTSTPSTAQQFTAGKSQSLTAPVRFVLVLVAPVDSKSPGSLLEPPSPVDTSPPPRPVQVPAYIEFSSLLI